MGRCCLELVVSRGLWYVLTLLIGCVSCVCACVHVSLRWVREDWRYVANHAVTSIMYLMSLCSHDAATCHENGMYRSLMFDACADGFAQARALPRAGHPAMMK